MKVNRKWWAAHDEIYYEHGPTVDYTHFDAKIEEELQQLKDFEKMMKAVNCTCKAVCDVLKSSNNPGLALAKGGHTEDFKSWPTM